MLGIHGAAIGEALADELLRAAQLFDQGFENRIEQGVIGQGIAVPLVRTQLGAGGFGADRGAHQLTACR